MELYDLSEAAGAHEPANILSVSPFSEDHESLSRILEGRQWVLTAALTACGARQFLLRDSFMLVVYDCELAPGSWQDLLNEIVLVPRAPFLIVTSRHADDRLWSEALNLGAYDVLIKPFDRIEVLRALHMARVHWNYKRESLSQGRARVALSGRSR